MDMTSYPISHNQGHHVVVFLSALAHSDWRFVSSHQEGIKIAYDTTRIGQRKTGPDEFPYYHWGMDGNGV